MKTARISPLFGSLRELATPTTAKVLDHFLTFEAPPIEEGMAHAPWTFDGPQVGDMRVRSPKERAKAKAKRKARRKARRNQRRRQ